MTAYFQRAKKTLACRILSAFTAFTFSFSYIVPPSSLYAQGLPATVMNLPVPGTPVPLTPGFTPARIIGMTIHADNPLMFDFMVDPGDIKLNDQQTQDESLKLVKYFLASLTVPAEKLWVNLSPYEKDKIVPEEFGQTEMGAELLAQDYMLKQLTASLMNPEDELGRKFWDRVYEKAQKLFGTTEIPLNTFNKVWIVPEKAVVYVNGLNVFVLESRFKVMMEEDYLALQYHAAEHPDAGSKDAASGISSSIIKEVLLPEIEKEVNEGETFANLRQIHNSLILAAWYKQNLKESLLGKIYSDQGKTGGLTVADKETSRKIYDQYVEAFQKGVHNFIKEDYDPATKQIIPRKYFSGGVNEARLEIEDKTLPDPEVLKAFAGTVADASVITAGVRSPGEEVSFKMPFPKTTPSAASPLNAYRKAMFDKYSKEIMEFDLTLDLKRKLTDFAMIGQISKSLELENDSVFEGVLDELVVIGEHMNRGKLQLEAGLELISLVPLIFQKVPGESGKIIHALISLRVVLAMRGKPSGINKEFYEWVIENEPDTEIAGDFQLVGTLLEARDYFSSDDIAMLKREILGNNPPASLPAADLEKLARRLAVEPEYVDGVIEEYARAVGEIVERIPVVLSSSKERKAVDLFIRPSDRQGDVIISLIYKQEYTSKEKIDELRVGAMETVGLAITGVGGVTASGGVGHVADFFRGEEGLERLYGKTTAEDLRGDIRLLRELLETGLQGLTLTPKQMFDKTAIRNVIKDTILAASSPVMAKFSPEDIKEIESVAGEKFGETLEAAQQVLRVWGDADFLVDFILKSDKFALNNLRRLKELGDSLKEEGLWKIINKDFFERFKQKVRSDRFVYQGQREIAETISFVRDGKTAGYIDDAANLVAIILAQLERYSADKGKVQVSEQRSIVRLLARALLETSIFLGQYHEDSFSSRWRGFERMTRLLREMDSSEGIKTFVQILKKGGREPHVSRRLIEILDTYAPRVLSLTTEAPKAGKVSRIDSDFVPEMKKLKKKLFYHGDIAKAVEALRKLEELDLLAENAVEKLVGQNSGFLTRPAVEIDHFTDRGGMFPMLDGPIYEKLSDLKSKNFKGIVEYLKGAFQRSEGKLLSVVDFYSLAQSTVSAIYDDVDEEEFYSKNAMETFFEELSFMIDEEVPVSSPVNFAMELLKERIRFHAERAKRAQEDMGTDDGGPFSGPRSYSPDEIQNAIDTIKKEILKDYQEDYMDALLEGIAAIKTTGIEWVPQWLIDEIMEVISSVAKQYPQETKTQIGRWLRRRNITANKEIQEEKKELREIVNTIWSGFDDLKLDETIKITVKPSEKDSEKRVPVAEVGYTEKTADSYSPYRLRQELTDEIYIVELKSRTGKNNLIFNLGSNTDGLSWISVFQSNEFVGKKDERPYAIDVTEAMKTLAFRVFEDKKRIEIIVSKTWFDFLNNSKERKLIVDAGLETLNGYRFEFKLASSPVAVSEWIEKTLAGEENIELPAALLEAEKQKREYVIGGNWKMAVETEDKAVELIRTIAKKLNNAAFGANEILDLGFLLDVVIAVAPSFVHLPAVRRELKRLEDNGELLKGLMALGAQDVSAYDSGARTSETSAKQLADLGIRYVIIGHSERRRGDVRETSWSVNAKVKKALEQGLIPIIAVGETLEEREAGRTFDVLMTQFLESTVDLTAEQMKNVIIAYEPVWAIGTGKTATPEEADKAQRFLRAVALNRYGPSAAGALRIQYGGSMNAANVGSLIQKYNIDGGLIGGAALKPDDFVTIVTASLDHFHAVSSPVLVQSTPVPTPEFFADALKGRGLKVKGVEVAALKAQGGATVENILNQPYVKDAVSVSIAQALGSILFAGQGSEAKVVADSNAVWMGHESLVDMVTRNTNIAVASIASEGIRDGSVATPLGRIYWSGYENKYRNSTNRTGYEEQITMLRERGVQILYLLDDALENTNALKAKEAVNQPTDSWSVTAFHIDDGATPFRHMLDETNTRRLSVMANVSGNAGITTLDSPREVLKKLAAVHGIGELDSEEGRAFARKIIMAVLGERKKEDTKESSSQRHSFYIDGPDGILALEREYGVRPMIFGDGDLMPGNIAATGLKLDDKGSIVVKFGRSGLVEGEIMELGASQIEGAQFAARAVSNATTKDRVNPETALKVEDGLLTRLVDEFGYAADTFKVERTKDGSLRGKGIVAMTAVTGADPNRYLAGFAEQLKRITFNENDGTVILNTFLISPSGVFTVRTTLESDNLQQAKSSISSVSPEAKTYLAALESVRGLVNNLSGVLQVTPQGVEITDAQRFIQEGLPYLVNEARYGKTKEVKASARRLLREAGIALGIKEASIHDFYIARQRNEWDNLTTPAFNVRTGPTMLSMEEIISAAKEKNVGPFILELAASEQRYTGQDSSEYVAMAYAAAISVGYKGLLFLQADHYQTDNAFMKETNPVLRAEKRLAAIKKVEKNIRDAVLAGKLNIDVDPSTAVRDEVLEEILAFERKMTTRYIQQRAAIDAEFAQQVAQAGGLQDNPGGEAEGIWSLRRKLVDDMEIGLTIEKYRNTLSEAEQSYVREYGLTDEEHAEIRSLYHKMHEETLALTKHYIAFIRNLEKELKLKQPVSIGVEERHIDNKKHKKYPSTVLGSITLMNELTRWSQENGYVPPSKLALQTGAMHGIGGKVDWGIFERHQLARDLIGVAVFVQHGTSTLPPEEFANMPRTGSGEAHLATEYQKIAFRHIGENVPELRGKMAEYMEALIQPEWQESDVHEDILAKLKNEKLWEKRDSYKEKFAKKYDSFLASGLSRDEALISMLADDAPQGYEKYKGSVKDLVKELAGPFKKEIDNLPQTVKQAVREELRAEFDRIYTVQNVVNSRGLLDRIIPADQVQVILPARPEMLQTAIASSPMKDLSVEEFVRDNAIGLLDVAYGKAVRAKDKKAQDTLWYTMGQLRREDEFYFITGRDLLDRLTTSAAIKFLREAYDEKYGTSASPLNEGPEKKGGIDLNPGNMDLRTNYGADRIQLPMPDILLENIKIDGLVPIIIHVAPVANLPLLLGLADEPEADDKAGFQPQHSPADAPRRFKAREVEEIGLLN